MYINMGKPKALHVWKLFYPTHLGPEDQAFSCKYCRAVVAYDLSSMTTHLSTCLFCPQVIKVKIGNSRALPPIRVAYSANHRAQRLAAIRAAVKKLTGLNNHEENSQPTASSSTTTPIAAKEPAQAAPAMEILPTIYEEIQYASDSDSVKLIEDSTLDINLEPIKSEKVKTQAMHEFIEESAQMDDPLTKLRLKHLNELHYQCIRHKEEMHKISIRKAVVELLIMKKSLN